MNSGTLQGRQFELATGHMSIGRSDHCTVRFDPMNEKVASKQHAFIESRPDGFYLTDNNSTNGTYVNGQRIQSVRLNAGDSIQFGTKGVTAAVTLDSPQAGYGQADASAFETDQLGQNPYPPASQNVFDQIQFDRLDESYRSQNVGVINSVASIGLGHFQRPETPKSKRWLYIGIAVTLFTIVLLGLIVMGILYYSLGLVPALIAAVVAFVPAVVYMLPIVWLDRYDPEPAWLLALTFCWGALVAVILSIIVNTAVGLGVARALENPELGQALGTIAAVVFSAPIFEELTKGAGLLVIFLFFRKYFDGILDGIIFAGVIALGFATVENVLYYGSAFITAGVPGLIGNFIGRGILSPFAHVTFTAMTGIGFGIARESHNTAVKILLPVVGIFAAIALHMFWNATALLIGGIFGGGAILLIYLVIQVPFFICFVIFAFWIMWRQNKIIREMLAIDVARGLIPQDHFERATSAFKSTGWLLGSIFRGKFRPTGRYIRAIGKLGLSYWHIQRATAAQGQTASFQQNPILRDEVLRWRDQV
jgi:protease PrsW